MKTSFLIVVLLVCVALLGGMFYFFPNQLGGVEEITTFEECAEKYPVMESYPEQCATPDGKYFTRDIGNEPEKSDLIRITSPRPGETITNPLVVTGEARGYWFFEASFPVVLLDSKGNEIASGPAQALGEWMTEEFVPFKIELTFTSEIAGAGTLLLKKDNPSGLPENDDVLIVPVTIPRQLEVALPERGCFVGGCSSEVCSEDQDVASNCMYRPEYACYQSATCERQTNGACGWTQTTELKSCLVSAEGEL